MTRVIGLISGTSVDGIDAALVEISGKEVDLKVELLAGSTYPYPPSLRQQILDVCAGKAISMAEFAELDDAIAYEFAASAQAIQVNHNNAQLIGSHGQTVFHRPLKQQSPATPAINMAYSLQLGRGALIADLTRIPTVSNFRVADIAAGGEGAPLVPKIDACLLGHPSKTRCIQNIGGIGNVAYLPATNNSENVNISGWDTGPGNTLLDLAVQQLSDGSQTYDKDGNWAATGTPCDALVQQWLTQEYFQITPPKSTGREHFGGEYLSLCLADADGYNLSPADLLATLTELTVASIVHSYRNFLPQMPDEVLLCGGGSRNLYLKQRLQAQIDSIPVLTTDEAGVSADFKEAIAFAVLAYWHQLGITGNIIQATGARQPAILGELHLPIE